MKTVYLVGVGMGNPDTLTAEAARAIRSSELLIGAGRLLEPFETFAVPKLPLVLPDQIVAAIREFEGTRISVLLSGDPGFYSGAAGLYQRLDMEQVITLPGISSVNYFCAKLHTPWHDVKLVSAHGRNCNAVGEVQSNGKVFFLTGGKMKAESICRQLCSAGFGQLNAWAGERLSYPEERILSGSVEELARISFADLAVLLVENPAPIPMAPMAPGIPDDRFQRGKVPMTKEAVRTLAVSKLRLCRDSVVWDVGAGTGSVSVACSLAARQGIVYAVEKNEEALSLLRENKATFGVSNLRVIAGTAPEVLSGLPAPDCVFVGGSSGALRPILEQALAKNAGVRLTVTAVSLETLTGCLSAFQELNLQKVDVMQVTAAQARALGNRHLILGQNPVWILSGEGQA